MPKFTGDDVYVSVNGVVLSDHVDSVDVKDTFEQKDVTGMGASAKQKVLVKAKESAIDIDFIMDYANASVDQTLRPLAGSNTPFTVIVRPTSATASTTNPQFTLMALLPEWDYVNVGGVGDVGKAKAGFVCGDSTGIVKTP
jgi:hypothetical protein